MKKLSLLSLLLLSSTNCLASCDAMAYGFFEALGLAFLIISFTLYFLIHLFLLVRYFRKTLKNQEASFAKLSAASFLNTVLWYALNYGIFIVTDTYPLSSTNRLLTFAILGLVMSAIIASMIFIALPLYSWLFPTIEKKRLVRMLFFLYWLNPVQGMLTLTQIGNMIQGDRYSAHLSSLNERAKQEKLQEERFEKTLDEAMKESFPDKEDTNAEENS